MPPPLNLKQRLAALTVNSNARGEPSLPSPKTPTARLRTFFNPALGKRPTTSADNIPGASNGHDGFLDIMSKLIFQAGVDFETRPMVVMCASALPDPREVSYDLLLSRILSTLDLYVEADYTVVFFAAGGRNTPGWNWVWKAYRSLSRKYRKNLKRLYIVHSNFFTKMLFSLAGAIISPKFFRKITYIDTLSELAYHIPLTQIDIPPAVYQENLKHEKQINLPVPNRADLFGVPLEELMGFNGEKGSVPRVVKDCIQFLRESGMQEEGLFRRSPNSVLLKQVQQAYDRGHVVSLDTFGDPHLAAVLLKKYLRDLPEPLFPESTYPSIRRCPVPTDDPSDMTSIVYLRDVLLPELPHCAYILLSHVLNLLHEVSLRSASNRMDAHNLAVVICPNLVSSSSPIKDIMMCSVPGGPSLHTSLPSSTHGGEGKTTLGTVIKHCIQRYYEIFDELPDRTEALPTHVLEDASSSNEPSIHEQPWRRSNRDSVRSSMHEDDEDIDDAMLLGTRMGTVARSMHTAGATGGGVFQTNSKAKSMISIEKGGGTSRRGSIAIGRGTTRKSAGSAVEAAGITAAGFFTAPTSAPPVPDLPTQ
ncbi:Rho-GAP domain-containing protein [Abortiporus biennis]